MFRLKVFFDKYGKQYERKKVDSLNDKICYRMTISELEEEESTPKNSVYQ